MIGVLRRTCAAVPVVLVLAVATSPVFANRLAYNSDSLRIVWTELTFFGEGGGFFHECPLTLDGTFHSRTMAKTVGLLVGHITRARVAEPCGAGAITTRLRTETLPWAITYASFTGTLPRITSDNVRIIGLQYTSTFRPFGLDPIICHYVSTTMQPVLLRLVIEANGTVTSATKEGTIMSSTFGCPSLDVNATGGTVTNAAGAAVRVTLV